MPPKRRILCGRGERQPDRLLDHQSHVHDPDQHTRAVQVPNPGCVPIIPGSASPLIVPDLRLPAWACRRRSLVSTGAGSGADQAAATTASAAGSASVDVTGPVWLCLLMVVPLDHARVASALLG